MILDRRAGSIDLLAPLQMAKVPVELGDLSYGDIQIVGNGPEGCPILVGVEYKKLGDLIQCIDNGRLVGHQLPGMIESYSDVWLMVEGIWRRGNRGEVEVPRNSGWKPAGISISALDGFLLTLQIKLSVKVQQCGTSAQTVQFLSALNRWWTKKEWEEHRAHLSFDNSSALTLISRPSICRRVAKELPGCGWTRSGAVAKHFGSVVEMVNAPQSEWETIEGIGKGTAAKIVKSLEGE